jgi:hypothetical protein
MAAIAARAQRSAVWTGPEMIVFGANSDAGNLNDLFAYTPGKVMCLHQNQ